METLKTVIFSEIEKTITSLSTSITEDRKKVLQPLISYIQDRINNNLDINLNFICTHNSRRSHLSQIWAQTMAYYFNIPNVYCYSGGTEATAMNKNIVEALLINGFEIQSLTSSTDTDVVFSYDADWGNPNSHAPYIYDYFSETLRDRSSFSQEFRLISDKSDFLSNNLTFLP